MAIITQLVTVLMERTTSHVFDMTYANINAEPIRVVLVLSSLDGAGAERQTVSLASHFDQARVEPTIVALKQSAAQAAQLDVSNVRYWSPRLGKGVDVSGARRFAAYLRESCFDVALCANQYATLQTLLGRRIAGMAIPVVSVFHSSPGHIGNDLRSRVQFAIYRSVLRQCAGLIYVSDLQKNVWEGRKLGLGTSTSVINNGIDLTPFAADGDAGVRRRLGWSGEDYVVGICAHLRREKRVHDLVLAVRQLLDHGVPARLLIVGDGPCRSAIEAACRENLRAGHWAMVGMQQQVAPFIQACDAMALVSEVEAFSIGILEAMASGKPMVVTDVGGAREQIVSGIHGFVVPVGEPAKIADALERMWREGSLCAFGAAARARVTMQFSIESMVNKYSRLLADTVLRSGRLKPV